MALAKRPFWIGIILSPLLYLFLWFLVNKPQVEEPQKSTTTPSVSLDIIPTTPRTAIPTRIFHQILEDGSKKDVKLTDFAGKPTIVHYWATWCAPCVEEMPELDEFAQKYGDKINLVVIAKDQTGGTEAQKFFTSKGFKSLKLYVSTPELDSTMKIVALPTTIFVSSDSLEMGRVIGPIEWLGNTGEFLKTTLVGEK